MASNKKSKHQSNNKMNNSYGFLLTEYEPGDFSLLSLRIALESYFSTYQAMRYYVPSLKDSSRQEELDYTSHYYILYVETMVHFHHFFELICKKILASEHPIFALSTTDKPLILRKLVNNIQLDQQEIDSVKSIEMSETLKRLAVLLDEPSSIIAQKYAFLKNHMKALGELNDFRNRILHRGRYVLSYEKFDLFIGSKILSIIQMITDLPILKEFDKIWKYAIPKCGIDPIKELVIIFKTSNPKWQKIALLKEIGRASYKNPLKVKSKEKQEHITPLVSLDEIANERHLIRAHSKAEAVLKSENVPYYTCPICGVDTLSVYFDQTFDTDKETGEMMNISSFPYDSECHCCSFEPSCAIWAKKVHGYDGLEVFEELESK